MPHGMHTATPPRADHAPRGVRGLRGPGSGIAYLAAGEYARAEKKQLPPPRGCARGQGCAYFLSGIFFKNKFGLFSVLPRTIGRVPRRLPAMSDP